MSRIKELRLEQGLTQQQAADLLGISLRSFKSYENDKDKIGTFKYNFIIEKISALNPIDEDHGILTPDYISDKCSKVLSDYPVHYCILFGSYANGSATDTSDVDLLISSDVKGLKFYEMTEKLRVSLRKRVDVLDINQLKNNIELTDEILKNGIRIYENA